MPLVKLAFRQTCLCASLPVSSSCWLSRLRHASVAEEFKRHDRRLTVGMMRRSDFGCDGPTWMYSESTRHLMNRASVRQVGTECQFAALRRFSLESEVLLPCWRALLHA
jgi:hypothetical protein